jgi:hypothetical protein
MAGSPQLVLPSFRTLRSAGRACSAEGMGAPRSICSLPAWHPSRDFGRWFRLPTMLVSDRLVCCLPPHTHACRDGQVRPCCGGRQLMKDDLAGATMGGRGGGKSVVHDELKELFTLEGGAQSAAPGRCCTARPVTSSGGRSAAQGCRVAWPPWRLAA